MSTTNRVPRRAGALTALALMLSLAGCALLEGPRPAFAPADLVVVNANVLTVDDRFSMAQAFAVVGGRIAAIGDSASVRRYAGPSTRVIDAGGRIVIPAIAYSHLHTADAIIATAARLTGFQNGDVGAVTLCASTRI